MYDVIIAGAGPAGLTAAVYSARKQRRTLLVSKDMGGQPNWTLGVENYMGYQFIEGPELMRKFLDQARQFPIDVRVGETARAISLHKGIFTLATEGEISYEGLTIIAATGKSPRTLNVPGEKSLIGRGVSYCATCDAPFFRGRDVAVVGGGNSAVGAALDLVKVAKHVYLISLTVLTADHVLVKKLGDSPNTTILTGHETLSIIGEELVGGLVVRDLIKNREVTLEVEGVFVEIGLSPNSGLIGDLVPLNSLGEIEVSCANETIIPGLFAAGDVTNVPEKQIVVAAGEGAKAALQAHRFLQRQRDA
ncbi:MAG TPA: FAD-dependent oxidoreductase [Syntrophorhabdaceae bacterium]|jgi:alkyl hydroperoxide reductase subunit F